MWVNPLTAEWALRALIDFTVFNARRFYSSMGNPLDGKGLTASVHLNDVFSMKPLTEGYSVSSRIFIAVLHLYSTRGDTKMWAKIISAHARSAAGWRFPSLRWVGQKRGLCSDLSGHERKTGRLQVWRSNKYSAQYPWVLRWSLEKKRVNLCIARGPFGAITSMKIVRWCRSLI